MMTFKEDQMTSEASIKVAGQSSFAHTQHHYVGNAIINRQTRFIDRTLSMYKFKTVNLVLPSE